MTQNSQVNEAIAKIIRESVDEGKLIDIGWQILRTTVIHPDAPQVQINEMRMAFFAGAQHLYSCIMGMLESGTEPTQPDLDRMQKIDDELRTFSNEFRAVIKDRTGEN